MATWANASENSASWSNVTKGSASVTATAGLYYGIPWMPLTYAGGEVLTSGGGTTFTNESKNSSTFTNTVKN